MRDNDDDGGGWRRRRNDDDDVGPLSRRSIYGYEITGRAAHARIAPLLPSDWVDLSPYADNDRRLQQQDQQQLADSSADEDSAAAPSAANDDDDVDDDALTKPPVVPDFLWSNAPRHSTRHYRDSVSAYSHLPNGTAILDDKWALARLLSSSPSSPSATATGATTATATAAGAGGGNLTAHATTTPSPPPVSAGLESHCFRGPDGFAQFCRRVGMFGTASKSATKESGDDGGVGEEVVRGSGGGKGEYRFPDLLTRSNDNNEDKVASAVAATNAVTAILPPPLPPPPPPDNLWVIKDAMSNGAGGIWVVDPTNAASFLPVADDDTTPPSPQSDESQSDEPSAPTPNNSESNSEQGESISGRRAPSGNDTTPTSSPSPTTPTTNQTATTPPTTTTPTPTTPLLPSHRYVAQRYVWPPTLYGGRKFHVRVYALLTSDGRAYVHRRCFLHVANELFRYDDGSSGNGSSKQGDGGEGEGEGGGGGNSGNSGNSGSNNGSGAFDPSVHITNCCANSHDITKFAGEICADLELELGLDAAAAAAAAAVVAPQEDASDDDEALTTEARTTTNVSVVPLAEYYPAISCAVAALASASLPFLRGGEANGGFEYLGLDFILSEEERRMEEEEEEEKEEEDVHVVRVPTAHLLEVNAPPSQDTATGLEHAECLHDDVLRDLLHLWVVPRVTGEREEEESSSSPRRLGGWRCVYGEGAEEARDSAATTTTTTTTTASTNTPIVPSKAAILNRVRWGMYERRMSRLYEAEGEERRLAVAKAKAKAEAKAARDAEEASRTGKEEVRAGDDDGCYCSSRPRPATAPSSLSDMSRFIRSRFPYFAELDEIEDRRRQQRSAGRAGGDGDDDNDSDNDNDVHHPHRRPPTVFAESAGGAQVPHSVLRAVSSSLACRHRSVYGYASKSAARRTLLTLLGADPTTRTGHYMFLGPNVTSLFGTLAHKCVASGFLGPKDEIVISTENHRANIEPWLAVAERCGARIKWWTTLAASMEERDKDKEKEEEEGEEENENGECYSSPDLSTLLTDRTRIVAISHASNVLGELRDVKAICATVREGARGGGGGGGGGGGPAAAHVVVDGVAAAPHAYAAVSESGAHWYGISCHKLFGPHLGGLCGTRTAVRDLASDEEKEKEEGEGGVSSSNDDELLYRAWEVGTVNFEGCAGVGYGLGEHFAALARFSSSDGNTSTPAAVAGTDELIIGDDASMMGLDLTVGHREEQTSYESTKESQFGRKEVCSISSNSSSTRARLPAVLLPNQVIASYKLIESVEAPILDLMLSRLRNCNHVRAIGGGEDRSAYRKGRIPIISFVHAKLKPEDVVRACQRDGVICRSDTFLAGDVFLKELGLGVNESVVRLSFAHYNTLDEAHRVLEVLESLEGWW